MGRGQSAWRHFVLGLVGASLAAASAANAPAHAVEPFDVAATLSISFSSEVAISGDYAYVASNSAITIIDTRTNTVDTTVAISGANSPDGAAAIDGKVVFAARSSNKLIIMDATTRAVSYLDTTGCTSPSQLRVVNSTRLIANCHATGNVQVYDMTGPSIVGTVTTGLQPRGMSVSDGRVFVPNSQGPTSTDTMTVVDAAASTPTALATVTVENQPEFTAYLDDRIFVANYDSNTVSIIDGTSYSVLATVAVGTSPQGLAACTANVYSANRNSEDTSVMSPSSNSVTSTIPLAGPGATTHVVGAVGNYAYFLNYSSSTVTVVDCTDQSVEATIPIGVNPSKIAFASEYAYVTTPGNPGTLTVIAMPPAPDPDPTPGASPDGARYAEFVFSLPDGRECTSISPARVRVGSMYTLPGVDADCRPVAGATVAGWAVPQSSGSTEYGSVAQPYPPGLSVRVIDSQHFTVVPVDPTLRIDYDANVALADTCTATVDEASRMRQMWVPRTDVDAAQFAQAPPCTPPGHVLVGWNTAGDGQGQTFLLGDPLPEGWQADPANVHHLYAMWAAQPSGGAGIPSDDRVLTCKVDGDGGPDDCIRQRHIRDVADQRLSPGERLTMRAQVDADLLGVSLDGEVQVRLLNADGSARTPWVTARTFAWTPGSGPRARAHRTLSARPVANPGLFQLRLRVTPAKGSGVVIPSRLRADAEITSDPTTLIAEAQACMEENGQEVCAQQIPACLETRTCDSDPVDQAAKQDELAQALADLQNDKSEEQFEEELAQQLDVIELCQTPSSCTLP